MQMQTMEITPDIKSVRKDTPSKMIEAPPSKITVPNDQKLMEMFTTDMEKIQMYIDSSPIAERIDSKVIRKINEQAMNLSIDDFDTYLGEIGFDQASMYEWFQNIIDNNRSIGKIHKKLLQGRDISEDEAVYLMNWQGSNHSNYRYIHLGETSMQYHTHDVLEFE